MIDEARPYAEYKSTQVPWLGDIPSHWEVRPLRTLLKQRNEKNRPLKTTQILSLSIAHGVTLYSHEGRGGNKSKSDLTAYKIARKGDIVMNSMNVVVGAVGLSKYTGAISPVYYALYPLSDNADIHYYDAVFSNHTFQRYLLIYGKGILIKEGDSGKLNTIRMKISSDDLKTIPLPFPTPEEQSAIARFLNWKKLQIKRFIRNRRRLIEVLNEQKQAIINRAVTCGLNPDTPLNPSGIDWLGDIPTHWKACRLKHLLSRPLTYGANAAAELSDRNCPRYIRITDIDKYGHLKRDSFCSLPPKVAEPYMLQDGDILLARSGATVGKSFLYSSQQDGPAAHAGYLINARVDQRKVLPAYLYTCLQSAGYWRWIASMTIQATIQNVSAEKYANLWISVPPVDEQRSIIESVEEETTLPMALSSRAEQEIALIREYRTRLISDVVTGKIDVRHMAPPPGDKCLEETVEALKALEDDIVDDVMDEEEEVNEFD